MAQDVNVRIGAKEDVSKASQSATKAIRDLEKTGTSASKTLMAAWSQLTIIVAGLTRVYQGVQKALAAGDEEYQARLRAEQLLRNAVDASAESFKLSTQALFDHANALSQVTQFGDEVVQGAQAILLSFGRISSETMPRATEATLNLAAALGTDLQTAAQRLGLALADPERASRALRQANVILTHSQEDQIKAFVAAGEQAKAMGVILDQLDTQYGGFAESVGRSSKGVIGRFENLKGDLLEVVGSVTTALRTNFINSIMPLLQDMLDWLTENAPAIYAWLTKMPDVAKIVFRMIGDILKRTFEWDTIKNIIGALLEGLYGAFKTTINMVFEMWKTLFETINIAAQKMGQDWPKHLINGITGGLTNGGPVGKWLMGKLFGIEDWRGLQLFDVTGDLGQYMSEAFKETGADFVKTFTGAMSAQAQNIKNTWQIIAANYSDITTEGAKDIAAVIEAGKLAFTEFLAGEYTPPGTGGDEPKPGRGTDLALKKQRDTELKQAIESVGAVAVATIGERLAMLYAAWAADRQVQVDSAYKLGQIARYGAEYVDLQDELRQGMDALLILTEEGYAEEAAALMANLQDISRQMEAIRNPGPEKTGKGLGVQKEDLAVPFAEALGAALGGLEGIVTTVAAGLGGLAEQIIGAVLAFGPMGLDVVAVQQIMQGFTNILGPLVNRILQPFANLLQTIGAIIGALLIPVLNALSTPLLLLAQIVASLLPIFQLLEIGGAVLSAVFQLLAPILQAFAVVLEVVMAPIRFLGDLFTWIAEKIRFAVTSLVAWVLHPFSKERQQAYISTQGVTDPGKFTSDAFSGLGDRINQILALSAAAPTGEAISIADLLGQGITEWNGPGTSPGEGTGVYGGSVTVTQPPDIYIHVHIGEGGVAVMGDRELRQVGDVVVAAIETVLGAGGRVSWLPAGT